MVALAQIDRVMPAVRDDQFDELMTQIGGDVRKVVYSLAVIIGLLIAILGLYAIHVGGALPSASP